MEAWVTLTTNDHYSAGAMVLGASLRRVKTTRKLVCMVTQGVGERMRASLSNVFDRLIVVEEMDSGDAKNLQLLNRHDLGITFTKIRCWTLTEYSKCVFLDADTLVVQNSDELFDREEFSAAPDAGWPDCFNSGVFVFRPNMNTYSALLEHARESGSFDGGDQGLLNTFFSSWATTDINKHLPFIYNMVASATYSYLPAFKKFGSQVKIVHFIGETKPWLVHFDNKGEPKVGETAMHTKHHLQLWWQIFSSEVKPMITEASSPVQQRQDFSFMQESVGVAYSSCPPPPPRLPEDKRSDWERGTPDFTGTAAFNNILKKIDETLKK